MAHDWRRAYPDGRNDRILELERELASAMLTFTFLVGQLEAPNRAEPKQLDFTLKSAMGGERAIVRVLRGEANEFDDPVNQKFLDDVIAEARR